MKKVAEWTNKYIKVFFAIMMAIILLSYAVMSGRQIYSRNLYKGVTYLVFGPLLVCAVLLLGKLIGKVLKKFRFYKWVLLLLCCGHFLMLVFAAYHYWFKTGWDAAIVTWSAQAIATGDWNSVGHEYMSIYPNNILLACMEAFAIKAGQLLGINYYLSMIIQQSAVFAMTGYLLFLCLQDLFDVEDAVGGWCLYLLFVGVSPWVVIPYSDGLGLFMPVLLFWVYLKAREKRWIKWVLFLLPLLTFLGYKLKPQIAIMGIAVFVTVIISVARTGKIRDLIEPQKLLYVMGGLLLGLLINQGCISLSHVQIDPERQIGGISHYFMMGLHEESGGICNPEDIAYSLSFDTLKERKTANWELAWERLDEKGAWGLTRFWNQKVAMTYSDGTFGWWGEGSFFQEEQYTGNQKIRAMLTDIYYPSGSGYQDYLEVMQLLWIGILVFCVCVICRKSARTEAENVMLLAIMGLTLFEMLFEARSRYLFAYAPVFVMIAVVGVRALRDVWRRRENV